MPGPASSTDDDIIERRPTDPVATAVLAVAAVCLLGAIGIQFWECYEYKGPTETSVLGLAQDYSNELRNESDLLWNQFEKSYKAGSEATLVEGRFENGNFVPEGPMPFPETEAKKIVERLCAEYNYGATVYRPALKAHGIELQGKGVEPPTETPEKKESLEDEAVNKLFESMGLEGEGEGKPSEKKEEESSLDLDIEQ